MYAASHKLDSGQHIHHLCSSSKTHSPISSLIIGHFLIPGTLVSQGAHTIKKHKPSPQRASWLTDNSVRFAVLHEKIGKEPISLG